MRLLLLTMLLATSVHARSYPGDVEEKPFPGTNYRSLFQLTQQRDVDAEANWSGAHWNHKTKTLWLCRNKWGVRAYKFNDATKSFKEYKSFHFKPAKDYDFESITQQDLDSEVFLLLNEKKKIIQEFDLSGKAPKLLDEWSLGKVSKGQEAFEGMAFIPNGLLAKGGLVDGKGKAYKKSKYDPEGIVLVSDQSTGFLYAIDLAAKGDIDVIGRYFLPLDSARGLELDRESGYLYAVDGSHSAKFTLESVEHEKGGKKGRAFKLASLFEGPGPDAAEGLAIAPNLIKQGTVSVFVTDDDNLKGAEAVRWYDIKW